MAERDPYGIGLEVLNDTPHYIHPGMDNRRGTERSLGFCSPYGYEEGDPRVAGGTAPASAESYQWQCRNYAQGRYKMICANGHVGYMRLCYGHVWMIQHHHSRAKNGLCPRCAWPPRARELDEKMTWLMRQMADPYASIDDRRRWSLALEDCRAEMTELFHRGSITTGAPLRLEEVS